MSDTEADLIREIDTYESRLVYIGQQLLNARQYQLGQIAIATAMAVNDLGSQVCEDGIRDEVALDRPPWQDAQDRFKEIMQERDELLAFYRAVTGCLETESTGDFCQNTAQKIVDCGREAIEHQAMVRQMKSRILGEAAAKKITFRRIFPMANATFREEQIYEAAQPLIDHARLSVEGRKALEKWDEMRPSHGQQPRDP